MRRATVLPTFEFDQPDPAELLPLFADYFFDQNLGITEVETEHRAFFSTDVLLLCGKPAVISAVTLDLRGAAVECELIRVMRHKRRASDDSRGARLGVRAP